MRQCSNVRAWQFIDLLSKDKFISRAMQFKPYKYVQQFKTKLGTCLLSSKPAHKHFRKKVLIEIVLCLQIYTDLFQHKIIGFII